MSYQTFTITIQDGGRVMAEKDDGGREFGVIELDNLRRETIDVFEEWLRKRQITQAKELRVLGSHLYKILFGDEKLKTFFETSRKAAQGERMRVQLRFQKEAADLSTLPWEYLYCPDTETGEGYFLSTNVDLVLSRYIYRDKAQEPIFTENDPLKILIVVSSPSPLHINAAPVIEEIHKLRNYFKNYQIEITTLEKPTVLSFYDALKEVNPHIVHFIGHGRFDRSRGAGEIALVGADGASAFWQEDKTFADIFIQARPVTSLVFLHLCQEAREDLNANFAGLAPRLIQARLKAVIAMHYPISTEAAVTFCRFFYRELLNQARVDDAVQTARSRVKTATAKETPEVRDFGTPALFMYSSEALIPPPVQTSQPVRQTGNIGKEEGKPEQKKESGDSALVERLLAAGEVAMEGMTLTLNEKMACYQEIAELATELQDQMRPQARQILFQHYARAVDKTKSVVLAMIEAL